jgi:hypothetical protein
VQIFIVYVSPNQGFAPISRCSTLFAFERNDPVLLPYSETISVTYLIDMTADRYFGEEQILALEQMQN